jgi:hypothetical protein
MISFNSIGDVSVKEEIKLISVLQYRCLAFSKSREENERTILTN